MQFWVLFNSSELGLHYQNQNWPIWMFNLWIYIGLYVCDFVFVVNNPKKSGPTLNETFLGLLYPTENYKVWVLLLSLSLSHVFITRIIHCVVLIWCYCDIRCRYGYLTNTKVKFILVTTDLDVKDADVRNVSIALDWILLFLKNLLCENENWCSVNSATFYQSESELISHLVLNDERWHQVLSWLSN